MTALPRSVAAWVGERPVLVDDVDRRMEALRRGRWSAVLPHPATAEGRQLRRWTAQVVVTEALLDHLAADLDDNRAAEAVTMDGAPAFELGSIVAAALAASPAARRVYDHVVGGIVADAEEVRGYYDRNQDLFAVLSGTAPFSAVADDITAELTRVAQRRHFLEWLDNRRAELVRLEPGYEHPADPHQPDATHRH
jgi:[acyl-carrier-protein] S-malonyltransferase